LLPIELGRAANDMIGGHSIRVIYQPDGTIKELLIDDGRYRELDIWDEPRKQQPTPPEPTGPPIPISRSLENPKDQ